MKTEEISQDDTMQTFLSFLSNKKSTIDSNVNSMVRFTEWTGKTPTELIVEAKEDQLKYPADMTRRRIFRLIPAYKKFLLSETNPHTGKKLSNQTVIKYLSSIYNFYKMFYIETPHRDKTLKKSPLKENEIKIDIDGIRAGIKKCDTRNEAIVLCGINSGMSAVDICSLTVEAFEEGYDSETGITTFDMRRRKTDVPFITFVGPEASAAILEYLKWRDRPPESNRKRDMVIYERRKVTPDSYLFILERVSPEYDSTGNEELRKMKSNNVFSAYAAVSAEAQISTPKGQWNTFRSHNMRKFFSSMLKNGGADSEKVNFFMGHTLGVEDHYYEADIPKLKKMYAGWMHHLYIAEKLDIASNEKYQKMKARAEESEVMKYELIELKKELEEIKKRDALKKEGLTLLSDDFQKLVEEVAEAIKK